MHVDYYLVGPTFGINDATIIVQFNESSEENMYQFSNFVSYNVTSVSEVDIQQMERTRFVLVIPYNTQINVSVIVSTCEQYDGIPIIIQFRYDSECSKMLLMHA